MERKELNLKMVQAVETEISGMERYRGCDNLEVFVYSRYQSALSLLQYGLLSNILGYDQYKKYMDMADNEFRKCMECRH